MKESKAENYHIGVTDPTKLVALRKLTLPSDVQTTVGLIFWSIENPEHELSLINDQMKQSPDNLKTMQKAISDFREQGLLIKLGIIEDEDKLLSFARSLK